MNESKTENGQWHWYDLREILERTANKQPTRGEIEIAFGAEPYRFDFASPDEAAHAVAVFHERELAEARIEVLSSAVQERALAGFIAEYLSTVDDVGKKQFRRNVRWLINQGNFDSLEGYVKDVAESGIENANKALKHVDKAGKFRLALHGIGALIEMCVVFFVVAKCQHGFETLVVCVLAILYCYIANSISGLSLESFARYVTLQYRSDRIRRLLHDRTLEWSDVEQEQKSIENTLSGQAGPRYIRLAKLSLISLVCTVTAVYTVL